MKSLTQKLKRCKVGTRILYEKCVATQTVAVNNIKVKKKKLVNFKHSNVVTL